jgi:hypothetical protein
MFPDECDQELDIESETEEIATQHALLHSWSNIQRPAKRDLKLDLSVDRTLIGKPGRSAAESIYDDNYALSRAGGTSLEARTGSVTCGISTAQITIFPTNKIAATTVTVPSSAIASSAMYYSRQGLPTSLGLFDDLRIKFSITANSSPSLVHQLVGSGVTRFVSSDSEGAFKFRVNKNHTSKGSETFIEVGMGPVYAVASVTGPVNNQISARVEREDLRTYTLPVHLDDEATNFLIDEFAKRGVNVRLQDKQLRISQQVFRAHTGPCPMFIGTGPLRVLNGIVERQGLLYLLSADLTSCLRQNADGKYLRFYYMTGSRATASTHGIPYFKEDGPMYQRFLLSLAKTYGMVPVCCLGFAP